MHAPPQQAEYTLMRTVCLRSLSGEVLPTRDGPVFFTLPRNVQCLSYKFSLKDVSARGDTSRSSCKSARIYSLIVVLFPFSYQTYSAEAPEAELLGNELAPHYVPLTLALSAIAREFQSRADLKFEHEQQSAPSASAHRAARYKHAHGQVALGTLGTVRSLTELVDDAHVARTLHLRFVRLLHEALPEHAAWCVRRPRQHDLRSPACRFPEDINSFRAEPFTPVSWRPPPRQPIALSLKELLLVRFCNWNRDDLRSVPVRRIEKICRQLN